MSEADKSVSNFQDPADGSHVDNALTPQKIFKWKFHPRLGMIEADRVVPHGRAHVPGKPAVDEFRSHAIYKKGAQSRGGSRPDDGILPGQDDLNGDHLCFTPGHSCQSPSPQSAIEGICSQDDWVDHDDDEGPVSSLDVQLYPHLASQHASDSEMRFRDCDFYIFDGIKMPICCREFMLHGQCPRRCTGEEVQRCSHGRHLSQNQFEEEKRILNRKAPLHPSEEHCFQHQMHLHWNCSKC